VAAFPTYHFASRAALYFVVLGLIGCAPVHPAEPKTAEYRCANGRLMAVAKSSGGAVVTVGERSYQLKPKRSSLGERYVSSRASLIIDGTFAAFVAEDLLDLEDCHAVN
jgi:hypothetical protein